MSSWAAPGVKCQCIENDFVKLAVGSQRLPTHSPELKQILTVRGVHVWPDGIFLTFDELPIFQFDGQLSANVYWQIEWFRPLQTTTLEQDMELFVPFLAKQDEPA